MFDKTIERAIAKKTKKYFRGIVQEVVTEELRDGFFKHLASINLKRAVQNSLHDLLQEELKEVDLYEKIAEKMNRVQLKKGK